MSRILGQIYTHGTGTTDGLALRAETHATGAATPRRARDSKPPAICRVDSLIHASVIAGKETWRAGTHPATQYFCSAEG